MHAVQVVGVHHDDAVADAHRSFVRLGQPGVEVLQQADHASGGVLALHHYQPDPVAGPGCGVAAAGHRDLLIERGRESEDIAVEGHRPRHASNHQRGSLDYRAHEFPLESQSAK